MKTVVVPADDLAKMAGGPGGKTAVSEARDGDWLERLRQSVRDRADEYEQQHSLKEKLFPLSTGRRVNWMDIAYAEALWASILLAGGFMVFSIAMAGLQAAVGFVLSVVLYMLPVLSLWTLVGAYYIRKSGHSSAVQARPAQH